MGGKNKEIIYKYILIMTFFRSLKLVFFLSLYEQRNLIKCPFKLILKENCRGCNFFNILNFKVHKMEK